MARKNTQNDTQLAPRSAARRTMTPEAARADADAQAIEELSTLDDAQLRRLRENMRLMMSVGVFDR